MVDINCRIRQDPSEGASTIWHSGKGEIRRIIRNYSGEAKRERASGRGGGNSEGGAS